MHERMFGIFVIFTLSALAFTLIVFGFSWVYEIWLTDDFDSWVVTFIGIPIVALISALLVYLFCYALEDDDPIRQHRRY